MSEESVVPKVAKLPKQFKHWCEKAGIYIDYWSNDSAHAHMSTRRAQYLKGCLHHERYFRVLGLPGLIEVCDGNMDRWANSVSLQMPIPMTEKEFGETIALLTTPRALDMESIEREREYRNENIRRATDELIELEKENEGIISWVRKWGQPRSKYFQRERRYMKRYLWSRRRLEKELNRQRLVLKNLAIQERRLTSGIC